MDPVILFPRSAPRARPSRSSSRGFTLIEVMIALIVLAIGVLALASILGNSLTFMNMSQDQFLAQQKASEAVESIFAARDTQVISWTQIDNVSQGGIFLDGPQALLDPGPDGIVDTADDLVNKPDAIIGPGVDGILGTADDTFIPLSNFSRQITFQDNLFNNPNLKQISVSVTYQNGLFKRTYTLITYISSYS